MEKDSLEHDDHVHVHPFHTHTLTHTLTHKLTLPETHWDDSFVRLLRPMSGSRGIGIVDLLHILLRTSPISFQFSAYQHR